jgi:acyl-CoA synthetase (NDP forming)
MRLEALFQPRSIAVIGASEKPGVGRRMVASLDRIGFAGAIYPVNPAYPTILGHPCYPSIANVPEAPDVAVFCLGHQRVLEAFIAAARRGIKGAVIYDGGFAEQGTRPTRTRRPASCCCVLMAAAFVRATISGRRPPVLTTGAAARTRRTPIFIRSSNLR